MCSCSEGEKYLDTYLVSAFFHSLYFFVLREIVNLFSHHVLFVNKP